MAALAGKVAWVTGAGSGIGEATAIALGGEGAAIALIGRRREPLETVAAKIAKAGGKAFVVSADLGAPDTAHRIVRQIKQELGRLDILVNNAGANILERSWAKLTPERIKFMLDANQPEHMADLIVYIAKQPPSICFNEVVISPTCNRGYAHQAGLGPSRS